jgi:hypothetical protein
MIIDLGIDTEAIEKEILGIRWVEVECIIVEEEEIEWKEGKEVIVEEKDQIVVGKEDILRTILDIDK